MPSLLDEIRSVAATSGPGPSCRLRIAMDKMTAKDRAGVEEALADMTIPASVIRKVLVGRGFTMGKDAVNRHRKKECSCGRG